MSLDYTRYYEDGWKNKPDRSTPVVAEALNSIDDAIIEIEEVLNHGVSEDATVVLTGTEFEPFFANKGNILIHEMLGKTVQDGIPSPSNPVDMKSVKVDLTTRSNVDSEYSVADTSIVLRSFEDYKDRLFFEDGKYYVERNLAQFHVDENTSLYLQSVNDYGIANLRVIIPDVVKKYPNPTSNGDTMTVCDRFVRQKTTIANEKTVGFTIIYNSTPGMNYIYFRCDSSIAQTVDEFKAWLETHPVEVLYVLDTPTIEEVSIDDAIKLLSLMAFDGETHIIQDSVTKDKTVLEYPNNRVGGLALTGFCISTKNELKMDSIDSLMTTMMLDEEV